MSEIFVGINPEPYCDVCGAAGKDLRTPVEVCRDCYDIARSPVPDPVAVERASVIAWLYSKDARRYTEVGPLIAKAIEEGRHVRLCEAIAALEGR